MVVKHPTLTVCCCTLNGIRHMTYSAIDQMQIRTQIGVLTKQRQAGQLSSSHCSAALTGSDIYGKDMGAPTK